MDHEMPRAWARCLTGGVTGTEAVAGTSGTPARSPPTVTLIGKIR